MSTTKLERLASAAADELLDTSITETDTSVRRAELDRVRRNRRGARLAALAAGVVVVLIVVSTQGDFSSDSEPQPMEPVPVPVPEIDVGDVPVWYDNAGLHRGNIVEQTSVDIVRPDGDNLTGALALVRTGALYSDPATGDVWFHPWGGEPRVVGHNAYSGPGGDVDGDTAAWFDGSELVVYDTATGSEISRTWQSQEVTDDCCEHRPPGNGFKLVSAERVVWISGEKTYSHDVRTGATSVVQLEDAADNFVLRAEWFERYPDLEGFGRLSPSGNFVLAVESTKERHGAAIIDTRTGELWRVPKDVYSWITWSYGDIAMVDHTRDELLACDAARRTCETLPAVRPFLMPTN